MAIPFKSGVVVDNINSGKSNLGGYKAIPSGLAWHYITSETATVGSPSFRFTSSNNYIHTDGWQFDKLSDDMFVGTYEHVSNSTLNFTLTTNNFRSWEIKSGWLYVYIQYMVIGDKELTTLLTPITAMESGYGTLQGSWFYNGHEIATVDQLSNSGGSSDNNTTVTTSNCYAHHITISRNMSYDESHNYENAYCLYFTLINSSETSIIGSVNDSTQQIYNAIRFLYTYYGSRLQSYDSISNTDDIIPIPMSGINQYGALHTIKAAYAIQDNIHYVRLFTYIMTSDGINDQFSYVLNTAEDTISETIVKIT